MEAKSMNVQEKLFYIQQNLKAPKGQYNKFGNFYYRSCEDIQEAVKPLLKEAGAVLTVEDELVLIGERYYLKATARLADIRDGSCICNTAYAREAENKSGMDAAQVTGSCSSYARKYALNGLFCIDDAKDPDSAEGQQAPKPEVKQRTGQKGTKGQQAPKPGSAELAKLKLESKRTGTDLSKVCIRYKVQKIEDLSMEQYKRAMSAFRKMESVGFQADGQYELDFSGMENEMPFR